MGETLMAEKVQDQRRVIVKLSKAELNQILIQPAKDAGFIDFDPTRIKVDEDGAGYMITFEQVN